MKLKLGNVVKITVRKNSQYMITEVNEESQWYLLRRVDKSFRDCGNKTTFRVPFAQMDEIFQELVGTGSPNGAGARLVSGKRKASEVIEVNRLLDPAAIRLLDQIASGLSPENLTCDGELLGAQVWERKRELDRKWKAMELYFGCEIENDIT